MRIVRLRQRTGKVIWVDWCKVLYWQAYRRGGTEIRFVDGRRLLVKELPEDLENLTKGS